MVETPMGSTIDSIRDGGFWVCDRDRNCREVRGLWEAEEFLRERERELIIHMLPSSTPCRMSITIGSSYQASSPL